MHPLNGKTVTRKVLTYGEMVLIKYFMKMAGFWEMEPCRLTDVSEVLTASIMRDYNESRNVRLYLSDYMVLHMLR